MSGYTSNDIIEIRARVGIIRCYVQIMLGQVGESGYLRTVEGYLYKILSHLCELEEIVNGMFDLPPNNPHEYARALTTR